MPIGMIEICFLHAVIRNKKPSSPCTITDVSWKRNVKYSAIARTHGVVQSEMQRNKEFCFPEIFWEGEGWTLY